MENNDHVAILHNFSIEKINYLLEPINQGFINDTFLVFDETRPLYILQRINNTVFPDVNGLMNNLGKALDYLKASDYRRITLVKTLSGAFYFENSDGNCWRLMTYIDRSTAYDTTTNPEIAFEAGRIIGKFHQLLQNADVDDFVDTIPRFHDLQLRENQFNSALEKCSKSLIKKAQSAIAFAKVTLVQLKEWDQNNIPIRLCHNDTKLNNILFEKDTNKALCLIDLDTFMRGYFHYDFGDAIRTIVNTAPEDEKEHSKITFDKALFEAFVNGLSTNSEFLTEQEKKLLPFGAMLLPFLHGIRALTDYLNGNIYYRVSYEDQNLDRCLSLFDFTQKALDNANYMHSVIAQKL